MASTDLNVSTLFDPAAKWERSAKVALRPEPFGALAYHFETRRLVFLKSRKLIELVDGLVDHESAAEAIEAIVTPADEHTRRAHVKALESLADAGVIEPASPAPISFVG